MQGIARYAGTVGWGGAKERSWALARQHDATLEMGWGGVGADGTCCYADVTLMEHVASLVHVVTIREHRFD